MPLAYLRWWLDISFKLFRSNLFSVHLYVFCTCNCKLFTFFTASLEPHIQGAIFNHNEHKASLYVKDLPLVCSNEGLHLFPRGNNRCIQQWIFKNLLLKNYRAYTLKSKWDLVYHDTLWLKTVTSMAIQKLVCFYYKTATQVNIVAQWPIVFNKW